MKRRDVMKIPALGLLGHVLPASAVGGRPPHGQTMYLPWQHEGETLRLAVFRRPAAGAVVLYVHGATFPAALSVGWRMQGQCWLDQLQVAGMDAWAFDFAGYGCSDRPAVFAGAADAAPPFGRSGAAAEQIVAVLRHIRRQRPDAPIHLIAHSWGTLPARCVAIQHPELVARLVLFGPLVVRDGPIAQTAAALPAWQWITAAQQWPRQRSGMPAHLPTPVSDDELQRWCNAYLHSDPHSGQQTPPAVKVAGGPMADVLAMFAGHRLVNDGLIAQPTLIVRGEWDDITTDADAARLFNALSAVVDKRDVKIAGGNHWLHLQPQRRVLWAQTLSFLREEAVV